MSAVYQANSPHPIFKETLTNGLTLMIVLRKGLVKKAAFWAVPFGSLHLKLNIAGQEEILPAGVAHFLEHQLFRQADGSSISDAFAELGLQDNAYTSYNQTGYTFSGSDNFEAGLDLLLRFTADPNFTEESVANERDIINQEILMYRDFPETSLDMNLRRLLFQDSAAAQDIAGDAESIAQITPELLQRCHQAFYHPQNAVLVLVGDFEPAKIIEQIESTYTSLPEPAQASKPQAEVNIGLPFGQEAQIEERCARPIVALAFKDIDPQGSPLELFTRQIENELLLELLIGQATENYWRLFSASLVNHAIQIDCQNYPGFAYTGCAVESEQPDLLLQELATILVPEALEKVSEDELENLKRRLTGLYINSYDSFGNLARELAGQHLANCDYRYFPEILAAIDLPTLKRRAQVTFKPNQKVSVIMNPKAQNTATS